MRKEKIKVYTYTRVSTAMQIDGYSLDAQKSRMKAFADYNDYEIIREYQDAGKSGRSIEGRARFMQDKINTQVDTTAIDQEIKTCEKNLRNNTSLKMKLIEEMDALDFDDKHYDRKKADLNVRLDKAYDKIDELEDRFASLLS